MGELEEAHKLGECVSINVVTMGYFEVLARFGEQ